MRGRSLVRPITPPVRRLVKPQSETPPQLMLVRVAAATAPSEAAARSSSSFAAVSRPTRPLLFTLCGWLRVVAMLALAVQGLWPLLLQAVVVPKSVFGDGHGDRYEQLSYFAFENDHYQVLAPRRVACDELRVRLFPRSQEAPRATTDLVRAVDQATFLSVRELAANASAPPVSVEREILGLARDASVCFGGVDDEGAVQVEALLSATDAPRFGIDAACLQADATHVRVRLAPTEFFVSDTVGELNPARVPGAVLLATLVDEQLRPVVASSCYRATRLHRAQMTAQAVDYQRCVDLFSRQLLVAENCDAFALFTHARDVAGCAYAALGAAGAVLNIDSDTSYSFPAPWRMTQCTVAGDCSSLLFTQLWLSEWTVEPARGTTTTATTTATVLRHNFVNHKVIEVTVDRTFGLRLLVSAQILVLVGAAWLTSASDWHAIELRFASPWAPALSATTACTLTKIWRNQLTIDMLVGADARDAVLRATGCGTLVLSLGINLLFARTGSLKAQELEPGFAQVAALVLTVTLYAQTQTHEFQRRVRGLLVDGMHTVPASQVPHFSGCRGSSVCAAQVSMRQYIALVAVLIAVCATFGVVVTGALHWRARRSPVGNGIKDDRLATRTRTMQRLNSASRKELLNSFTRFPRRPLPQHRAL
ncbi:hypothetical protein PINS_up015948 [Pythium insidiosum]|nr:hypothetical protein PINS_up015948 [Pythium insidiosum]